MKYLIKLRTGAKRLALVLQKTPAILTIILHKVSMWAHKMSFKMASLSTYMYSATVNEFISYI